MLLFSLYTAAMNHKPKAISANFIFSNPIKMFMKCVMVHALEVYTHEAHTIPFIYSIGEVNMSVTSIITNI